MDVNNATLVGEMKGTPLVTGVGDSAFCATTLIVEVWVNNGIQKVELPIMAFGKKAEVLNKYGKPGSRVGIEGSLRLSKKGNMYISVRTVQLLGMVFKPENAKTSQPNDDDVPF